MTTWGGSYEYDPKEDQKLPEFAKPQNVKGVTGGINDIVRALMAGYMKNPNKGFGAPSATGKPLDISPPGNSYPSGGTAGVPYVGPGGNQLWGAKDPTAALFNPVPTPGLY